MQNALRDHVVSFRCCGSTVHQYTPRRTSDGAGYTERWWWASVKIGGDCAGVVIVLGDSNNASCRADRIARGAIPDAGELELFVTELPCWKVCEWPEDMRWRLLDYETADQLSGWSVEDYVIYCGLVQGGPDK